jgi:hypothetical protein
MPLLTSGSYVVYNLTKHLILDFIVTGDDVLGISNKYTAKTFGEWAEMVAATDGGDPALLASLGITIDLRDGQ